MSKSQQHITVSLSIMGDSLKPDAVTGLLRLTPSRTWIKGDKIPTASGMNGARTNGWFLYTYEVSSSDPAIHFKWLLDRLNPVKAELRELKEQGHWMSICCTLSTKNQVATFILPSELVSQLAEMDLELDFTVAVKDVT